MLENTISYKGYTGSIEYSEEDNLFYGQILGIRSSISFNGSTLKEFVEGFHTAVDDYLLSCEERGDKPEKPVKTVVTIELDSETFRRVKLYADVHNISVDRFVECVCNKELILLRK